jgi:hypothetical protein
MTLNPKKSADLDQCLAFVGTDYPIMLRRMYLTFVVEGFTTAEALDLVKHCMLCQVLRPKEGDGASDD